jgi:hypothetical protein
LSSVYSLARLFHSRRKFQQASPLYQRALSGFQKCLGPTHPRTLACGNHYSSMVQEMENEGEEILVLEWPQKGGI